MENNNQYSEFASKVMKGVRQAQQKLLREKALHGESIVIADNNGNITTVLAQDVLNDE